MGGDWYVPKLYYGYALHLQQVQDILYNSVDFNNTHPELVNREDEYITLTSSVLDYLKEKIKLPQGLSFVFYVPEWYDRYTREYSDYDDLQLLVVKEVKTPLSGGELSAYKLGRRQTLEMALYALGGANVLVHEKAKFYVGFSC